MLHFKVWFHALAMYTRNSLQSTGPAAASYLQELTSFDLRQLTFGTSAFVPIEGFNVHVARGGYTGEDGFEVKLPTNSVELCDLTGHHRSLSLLHKQ